MTVTDAWAPRDPAAAHDVLWGRDHTTIGKVAAREVSPRVAIALTRGPAAKRYYYVDPDEDAVAAVIGPRATLLVVADGHNGREASEIVVTEVLTRLGDDPPPADLSDDALIDLFLDASGTVLEMCGRLAPPNCESRTTLTVALLAERRVQWAAMGDSALFVADGRRGRELTRPRHHFVGWPMSRGHVDDLLERGLVDLAADEWLVAVSDGFTNFVPGSPDAAVAAAVRDAADGAAVARALIGSAGRGGAGDNIAVAVAAPRR